MHRFLSAFCLIACSGTQAQVNPDLMKTPECAVARKQLDEVLAAGGPRDRLNSARERAALACLGMKAGPMPEGRFVPPPVAVDPIRLRAEPSLPRLCHRWRFPAHP